MIVAGLSDFLTGDLTDWVIDVIDRLGYLGVALLVALENVFPPIPSEVVLPAGGIHARDGGSTALGMIIAATIGSVAGAWILYAFAAWIGPDRLRDLVVRKGRWVGIKEKDLDKAEGWFERHEERAVLICRCVPLVRSLVSIPAGIERMHPVPFTVYTAVGSLIWNTALIMVGYTARQHWTTVQDVMAYVQYGVIVAIGAALGWFVWRRIIRVRLHPEDVDPDLLPPDLEERVTGHHPDQP